MLIQIWPQTGLRADDYHRAVCPLGPLLLNSGEGEVGLGGVRGRRGGGIVGLGATGEFAWSVQLYFLCLTKILYLVLVFWSLTGWFNELASPLLLKVWTRGRGISISWQLLGNAVSGPALDGLNRNLHFNQSPESDRWDSPLESVSTQLIGGKAGPLLDSRAEFSRGKNLNNRPIWLACFLRMEERTSAAFWRAEPRHLLFGLVLIIVWC